MALNVLKVFEVEKKPLSLRKKQFAISTNLEKYLENILALRGLLKNQVYSAFWFKLEFMRLRWIYVKKTLYKLNEI